MRSNKELDTRKRESSHFHGDRNIRINDDALMHGGDKTEIYVNENASNSYHSGSHDNRRSNDSSDNVSRSSEENWGNLRRLLSNFHHHVDVELPTLLERIRESEERLDLYHHGRDETSRHYFELRRCFRNIQELLLREDLLNLLDNEEDDDEDYVVDRLNEFSKANDKSDVSLLLRIFANDLVQLSSISILDDHGIGDASILDLHRSVVILSANRFPIHATLDDDQISQLLSRVLSLIEQESLVIRREFEQQRTFDQTRGDPSHEKNHFQRHGHGFELLRSLLQWLNREMTVERLSRGVLSDCDEAAMALRIPLEFLNQISSNPTSLSSSLVHHTNAILPPQVVLSLRVLIDLLLGSLNSLVVVDNYNRSNKKESRTDNSSPLSLREWMMMPRLQKHHGSLSISEAESNDYLWLLRLLDRYALELTEETLELLQPQRKPPPPPPPQDENHNRIERHELAASRKRDRHGSRKNENGERRQDDFNNHGAYEGSPKPTMNSMISQRQRVEKILQHAAMTSNFFSIMGTNGTAANGTTSGTNGAGYVFVGLSRSLWRALGRFIVEEVDSLGDNDDGTIQYWENDFDDLEEYRVAATDILLRLTKTQVDSILFHDRSKNTSASAGESHCDGSTRSSNVAPLPPPLSEEEFSIVVITILRLLGHPTDYWTPESQSWVAALLRVEGAHNDNDISGVNVASKLRKVLQVTLICTSYIPDALPFEEQCRVNSSLKELLLPPLTLTQPLSRGKKKHLDDHSTVSTTGPAAREDVGTLIDDPWESFWAVRQWQ